MTAEQPAGLPTGTVTFLFTDLESSTRLWEDLPEAMSDALARHDEILRDAVDAHEGVVLSRMGDGIAAVFTSAPHAVTAALDVQLLMAAEPWAGTGPLRARMALHTDEGRMRAPGEYMNQPLNRCARLMATAHGAQVLLSDTTAALTRGRLPEGAELVDLGEHRLRDVAEPMRVFQVTHPALQRMFPPLRSADAVPTNLPTIRTELIGRSDDLEALSELVRRERLVTLTGVGGVGKTRLALAVAATIGAGFADGCWLVEFAPVAGGDEVITAVAGSMRAPATDLNALAAYLADRRVLVVLDNCEHVLDAAAELVDVVLADGVDVHVLVTSREPLGLDGEHVRRVPSLGVPDAEASLERAQASAAVRLFAERATAVADGFTIDADNVAAVVEICRHLDGIPLAIELAAARVRAMPPGEIARRLDERFRLLAGGSRRSQERHRTLLATVAWSHDLCSDAEKVVFRRLAVFPATFGLDAADAVAGDGVVDVVECVLRLVDRSLVDYEPDAARYRLLETLRQYGADRLADAGETQSIREGHATWYLDLAERIAPGLDDTRFPAARHELGIELDNLRATADWCGEGGRWSELAGMSLQIWAFFEQDAPVDGTMWLQRVIEHASELELQLVVDALGVLAWIETVDLADVARGNARGEQSLSLSAEHELEASPWAYLARGMASLFMARHADALNAHELAFDVAEARGDERASVIALCTQSAALASLSERERSAAVAAEGLRRAELTGNARLVSAAIISWCSAYTFHVAEPDFAASLDVLARHDVGLRSGTINDMWLDIRWGEALLGLGRPGGVEYLVRGARSADRLGNPRALNEALREIAIAAAEAGLVSQAATLADYAETALRAYRGGHSGQEWIQSRLDQALGGLTHDPSQAEPHRRDIMKVVDDLEAALAERSLGAP